MKHITWNATGTDAFFAPFLAELGRHYSITRGKTGVVFQKTDKPGCSLVATKAGLVAKCPDLASAGRIVGALLGGVAAPIREKRAFETMGVMLDCSRNAVPTVAYVKEWLRRMSLAGFNLLMLYTEDTYVLEGEPFFGYLRGGYTAEDVREIDDYAALLGIELVPCIQTLGHLAQMLRWTHYSKIRDTPNILLAGEEETYAFIRKMISFWASNVRSRRIHIGMDEAHELGRGAYLDKNGYRPRAEILADHIARVNGICGEFGLRPMIWSDLLVPRAGALPDDVRKIIDQNVPEAVDLVYWEYTRPSLKDYADMLAKHELTGHRIVMGSAVWSWANTWYNAEYTERNMPPCMKACLKYPVKDFLLTMWNDDGATGDLDSCWNGVYLAGELAYHGTHLAERYQGVFGVDYDRNRQIAEYSKLVGKHLDEFSPIGLLWDDPLLGVYWHQVQFDDEGYWLRRREACERALAAASKPDAAHGKAGDVARARLILRFLIEKITLRYAIEDAHRNGAKPAALRALAARYRKQADLLERIAALWRTFWLARFRPNGLEVIQNRLGGGAARQRETALRLEEWAAGKAEGLPELDAPDVRCDRWLSFSWKRNSSSSLDV